MRASNAITKHYDEVLAPGGLTLNQYSLLSNLRVAGECTTSELAERSGLDRTTLVRTIKPLLDKGLMEDLSKDGERNRRLMVSEEGGKTLNVCIPLWRKAQSDVADIIGREHLAELTDMLQRLEDI